VASALASLVGPTCQPEKERGGRLVREGGLIGPWAASAAGPKGFPGAFLFFFGQNLFLFSVLFETFCKLTPNWF
jgi:hypothetical protein